jgi:hypothetical protein
VSAAAAALAAGSLETSVSRNNAIFSFVASVSRFLLFSVFDTSNYSLDCKLHSRVKKACKK